MRVSNLPEYEKERIGAIRRFHILDSEEDPDFDNIVETAALLCNTSMAVISLIDEDRLWFKARKGISIREINRKDSFCAYTILSNDILIVEDATKDRRFYENPMVAGEPYVRSYTGVPLITQDNFSVGTLAVFDTSAGVRTHAQLRCLKNLAHQVVRLMEMRLNVQQMERSRIEVRNLADIVEQTSDGIVSIDQLGLIRRWNTGAELLYGYTREEVIGKSVRDVVGGEIIPFDEQFDRFFYGNKIFKGEVRHLHKEGYYLQLTVTVSPLPSQTSDGGVYLLQFRDTSGRVRLETELHRLHEEAIRKANEKYRNIFENSLHGIFQATIEGRFITVNPAMAMMFDYSSPEEFIKEVKDISRQLDIDPRDRQAIRNMLSQEGKVTGFEFKAIRRNRQIIWLRTHIQIVFDNNGRSYFEGVVEDVTERKIADEKLAHQFEELKKINYELDRFVYSVSHDLRAPLSSILGITNIAEMEGPSEIQRKYLHMIRESIQRLDDFIRAILSYSRNARMELKIEEVSFPALIESMHENLRSMSGAERLNIRFAVEGDNPFYSDSIRVGIVVSNIYSNAIKYQDFKKDESVLQIKVTLNADHAAITFTDNGIGIPEQLLDKVFEMFHRAHDISKGSGLGLYIARETVIKLKGSIAVDSVFGQYTSFRVILPNLKRYF